jgi:DNA replication and repair protein RecF
MRGQAGPALRLERLVVRGFRNLADLDLTPGPRFNVLAGDNGQGKSNLLEAVYYLGALASFRGAGRDDLIAHGGERAILAGQFSAGGVVPTSARIGLDRQAPRKLSLDGKRPRSTSAWVGSLPMVLFHPGDVALPSAAPEARRAFLDRILEQMDATYASALTTYERALRSRNRLLKVEDVDPRGVRAYDEILASAGTVVAQARARLAHELGPKVEEAFLRVAGEELPLRVAYRPRVEPTVEALRSALARSFEKDLARGFTAEGPHADDLLLEARGRSARHHASQGQQRMIVLALKIAELDVLTRRVGRVPLLLLDDVSSELDRARNRRFFTLLGALGAQVFLTTTQGELIGIDEDRVDFHVEKGRVDRGRSGRDA